MYRTTFLAMAALLLWACGTGSLDVKPVAPHATESPAATSTPVPTVTPTPQPTQTPTPTSTPSRAGTPVTLGDVQPFVRAYVRAKWNYLSGSGTARGLYDLFTPDCQRMVSLVSMERTPAAVQALYKGLQGKRIEDAEFALPLGLNATAESLQIRMPLSSQTRLRVDGNWVTEFEWLYGMNPATMTDKAETLVVRPMGDSFRIASCESLRQWDQLR
jgi:hypothetical protein